MKIQTFAAIDVGSYEMSMKIFELSEKNMVREIDHLRHRLDLGSETYSTSKLTSAKIDELCRILIEFSGIMKAYKVTAYKAYGTSAIREMENKTIVLEQIFMRTGIKIDFLSNSEQRFLDYKSVASRGERFDSFIEETTVIVDVGGGSVQISLFDKGCLYGTQNLRFGILRLRDNLIKLNSRPTEYEDVISDLIVSQLRILKKLYLKDREIQNVIVIDEYLSTALIKYNLNMSRDYISFDKYKSLMGSLKSIPVSELARLYEIDDDSSLLMYISAIMVEKIQELLGGKNLWVPSVSLCDGIAYEYAEKSNLFENNHDFEKDIINSTLNISKRYMGSKKRGETLEKIALTIFDSMEGVHGLGERERLLLRLAALLHDCGKYISLYDVGEASFNIVMQTEIIGLSHREREIVAYVVRYNYRDFEYYESGVYENLSKKDYLTIAKLTAMLMVATGLDRSHREKFKNLKVKLKDRELIIIPENNTNITLEKGLISARANFFREIYAITPVIKLKEV